MLDEVIHTTAVTLTTVTPRHVEQTKQTLIIYLRK